MVSPVMACFVAVYAAACGRGASAQIERASLTTASRAHRLAAPDLVDVTFNRSSCVNVTFTRNSPAWPVTLLGSAFTRSAGAGGRGGCGGNRLGAVGNASHAHGVVASVGVLRVPGLTR